MRVNTIISVTMIVLGIWSFMPVSGRAADQALENMRSTVGNSRADLENYRKLLVELEKAKLKANDQEGATAAKLEIIKLDRELGAMEGGASRRTSKSESAGPSVSDKAAADKAAAGKAAAEKAAAEKAIAEKAAAEKVAAEKAAAAKAAAEKVAAEKAAAAKAAAEKAAAAKAAAAAKVAAEEAAAERALAAIAAAEKAAAEKAAAEKAAAEKAAAKKVAAEKAAAEKAAAEKAASDRAAAEKLAAEQAATRKAAAEQIAAEKLAALQAASEKAAAAKAAGEEAAARKATDEAQRIVDMKSQLRQLIAQGNDKLSAGDVQGAREVKIRVNEIQEELTRLGSPSGGATNGKSALLVSGQSPTASTPAHAPSPAPVLDQTPEPNPSPAPVPEQIALPMPAAQAPIPQQLTPVLRGPKTHTSSVQGLAGSQNTSKNNVYVFNLSEVGPITTLTYYATGRRSKDTSGNIWLVTPDGLREKVGVWKSGQFEISSTTEASSYTKFKPAITDISAFVKGAGEYKIEFEWTDGIAPLIIHRVEITS